MIAALLLGACSVLAFSPFDWFVLIWLTLAGLYALLAHSTTGTEKRSACTGALLGAAFGFGLFMTGVSWVYVSLSVFGGMPVAVAALATFLFCCVLSIYPALAGALFVRYAPPEWWQRTVLFASLWTLAEWLRGWVLTGFPWLAAGYAQAPPSPLAGFGPVFGVYGVTLMTVLLGALIGEAFRRVLPAEGDSGTRSPRAVACRRSALPILVAGVVLASGALLREVLWTTPKGEPLSVALLQGNVAQDLKWRPEKFAESLRIYYRLALENPGQLTVLPETALPAFLAEVPGAYLDELKKLAEDQHGDMLLGIAIGDFNRYANGAISLGQSKEQHYRKTHLVPFGEFVPPGFSWFLAMAHIPMSDFTPGAPNQTPLNIAGQKVAVNICYEDAFGEEIIRALPEATLLVNLSNVAWFGNSLAPAQHLQIAQMRALEAGRMMLRATNTGMTAIVGADGNVRSTLKPFTRAALRAEVQGREGSTPYVRWGNWPTIAFALLLAALFCRRNALS